MLIFLGLGSNVGQKEKNLLAAIDEINKQIGKVISRSAFYVTEPVGFESPNSFLNAACGVETDLLPLEVLQRAEQIEKNLGRENKSKNLVYHDRVIDIDILLMENVVIRSQKLTIPHPRMHERLFVLKPLVEIAPNAVHPVLNKSIEMLANALERK